MFWNLCQKLGLKWYHVDHEICEVLSALIKFKVIGATATHVARIHAQPLHSACNIFQLHSHVSKREKKKTKLYDPFLGIGFNCLIAKSTSRRQFTFYHKFPEIPGTHFINLRRIKSWVNFGAIQWLRTWDPCIGNTVP